MLSERATYQLRIFVETIGREEILKDLSEKGHSVPAMLGEIFAPINPDELARHKSAELVMPGTSAMINADNAEILANLDESIKYLGGLLGLT